MRNYSIAGKRGQWPAPEDTSLSYLILSYLTSIPFIDFRSNINNLFIFEVFAFQQLNSYS